jgi:hypothetical protein
MVVCTVVVAILAFNGKLGSDEELAKLASEKEARAAAVATAGHGSRNRSRSRRSRATIKNAVVARDRAEGGDEATDAANEAAENDVGGVEPYNPCFFLIKIVFMIQFFPLFGHMMYATGGFCRRQQVCALRSAGRRSQRALLLEGEGGGVNLHSFADI